ncbi:MAG: glucan biosynthesis protein [Alphaproteobacteria bacterium]|nr:glucan biosynthesis protein [Alphaproteobacteria bacterium]
MEIPTEDEIHDNIVAYWRPAEPAKPGGRMEFSYRLYWQDAIPAYPADIAKVVATRLGRAAVSCANPGRATATVARPSTSRWRPAGRHGPAL